MVMCSQFFLAKRPINTNEMRMTRSTAKSSYFSISSIRLDMEKGQLYYAGFQEYSPVSGPILDMTKGRFWAGFLVSGRIKLPLFHIQPILSEFLILGQW